MPVCSTAYSNAYYTRRPKACLLCRILYAILYAASNTHACSTMYGKTYAILDAIRPYA